MPDYKRFIAYFYEYIDGKRQRNAGFIKAEQRGGIWRINLQLKGRQWAAESLQIFGYIITEKEYQVTLLGKGYPQKDCFLLKMQLPEEWNASGGKRFEELSGMWIPCGERRCFISHWMEGEAVPEKLQELSGQADAVKNGEGESALEAAQINEAMTEQLMPIQLPTELPGGITDTLTNQPEDMAWKEPQKLRREPQETLDDMSRVLSEQKPVLEKNNREEEEVREPLPNAGKEGTPKENEKPDQKMEKEETEKWERMWNQLKNTRFVMTPFSEEEYECISICPRDVLWLRQQGWPVGRSSFMMQGFTQYHHLLFGRSREGDFILGVPGMANSPNQNTARALGYGQFRSADGKFSEQFGYWCHTISPMSAKKV